MLDWFGGEATVPELIQRKKYDKAERLLRKEFEGGRRDATLRLQLADVIALAGRSKEAVPIYIGLVDEFARSGHAPKAIAILKKIDKISPGRGEVAKRLATLIGDHGKGAAAAPALPRRRWPLTSRPPFSSRGVRAGSSGRAAVREPSRSRRSSRSRDRPRLPSSGSTFRPLRHPRPPAHPPSSAAPSRARCSESSRARICSR